MHHAGSNSPKQEYKISAYLKIFVLCGFEDGQKSEAVFPGIENNWPESIVFDLDGLYAQPLIVDFEGKEPMHVSVVCKVF